MALALVGDEAGRQHALRLHDADTAPEPAGARRNVVPQFVAVADHWKMHGQVFQRIVPRVGHEVVDAVGAVGPGPPAIGAFVDFQEDPVVSIGLDAGIGRERDAGRTARDDGFRKHRGQRLDDQVDHAVALGETRFRRGGGLGLKIDPSGAVTLIGRKDPSFDGARVSEVTGSSSSLRKAA